MANIKLYKKIVIERNFTISLPIFEILTFHIFEIKNLCQGHAVQHSQLTRSLADISFYKVTPRILALALTVSEM